MSIQIDSPHSHSFTRFVILLIVLGLLPSTCFFLFSNRIIPHVVGVNEKAKIRTNFNVLSKHYTLDDISRRVEVPGYGQQKNLHSKISDLTKELYLELFECVSFDPYSMLFHAISDHLITM